MKFVQYAYTEQLHAQSKEEPYGVSPLQSLQVNGSKIYVQVRDAGAKGL